MMLDATRIRFDAPVVFGATAALVFSSASAIAATPGPTSNVRISSAGQSSPAFQRSLAWGVLKARIIRWEALPDDWDGNEGVAPPKVAAGNAKLFVDAAKHAGAPLPSPFISGDGEIGFRWGRGDGFASVAFIDDHVVVFARQPNSVEVLKFDRPYAAVQEGFRPLFQALRSFG